MVHISKDVQTDGEAEDRWLRARGDAVGAAWRVDSQIRRTLAPSVTVIQNQVMVAFCKKCNCL